MNQIHVRVALLPFLWRGVSILIVFCGLIGSVMVLNSCSGGSKRTLITRTTVENAHGIKLPESARQIQEKRFGGLTDHGILSLFEIDTGDLERFIAQLKIKSRTRPVIGGAGDPRVNGWNVWPKDSPTFVPGNEELEGLKRTWKGNATPVEMLSCSSSKGDWLHVEIWSVADGAVIKAFTDWN